MDDEYSKRKVIFEDEEKESNLDYDSPDQVAVDFEDEEEYGIEDLISDLESGDSDIGFDDIDLSDFDEEDDYTLEDLMKELESEEEEEDVGDTDSDNLEVNNKYDVFRPENSPDDRNAHKPQIREGSQQLIHVSVFSGVLSYKTVQISAEDHKNEIQYGQKKVLAHQAPRVAGAFSGDGGQDHERIKNLDDKSGDLLTAVTVDPAEPVSQKSGHHHGKQHQHLLKQKNGFHGALLFSYIE